MAEPGLGDEQFARIPAWDGNPVEWRKYKKAVELWMEGENLSLAAQCRLPNFGIKWLTLLGLVPILVFNSIPQSTNGIPVQKEVKSEPRIRVRNICFSMTQPAIWHQ